MKWFNFFSDPVKETPVVKGSTKSTVVLAEAPIKSTWRNNMWVMTPEGVGILFQMGVPCVVHIVDKLTGETTKVIKVDPSTIRQAKYAEIPENRRGSVERANQLGYV